MSSIGITHLEIPEITVIHLRVFEDARGFFVETYHREQLLEEGLDAEFVQDNHSGSTRGSLRGLHYQIRRPQGKLIRVVEGEVFDVAADLRRSSSTFGRWVGVHLSADKKDLLWVPPGFAHGFYVLSDWAEVLYKTTEYYAPQWERSLLWSDPDLGIDWPVPEGATLLLSDKDRNAPPLARAEVYD